MQVWLEIHNTQPAVRKCSTSKKELIVQGSKLVNQHMASSILLSQRRTLSKKYAPVCSVGHLPMALAVVLWPQKNTDDRNSQISRTRTRTRTRRNEALEQERGGGFKGSYDMSWLDKQAENHTPRFRALYNNIVDDMVVIKPSCLVRQWWGCISLQLLHPLHEKLHILVALVGHGSCLPTHTHSFVDLWCFYQHPSFHQNTFKQPAAWWGHASSSSIGWDHHTETYSHCKTGPQTKMDSNLRYVAGHKDIPFFHQQQQQQASKFSGWFPSFNTKTLWQTWQINNPQTLNNTTIPSAIDFALSILYLICSFWSIYVCNPFTHLHLHLFYFFHTFWKFLDIISIFIFSISFTPFENS